MHPFKDIEVLDCPVCGGPGLLQEENGWCVYVSCLDCGTHSAELPYNSEEERLTAAKQVATLWNMGKVIHTGVGD